MSKSKIDKNIQVTREWLKKHGAEGVDFGSVTAALSAWEAKVKLVEVAKAQLVASKEAAVLARKDVGLALAEAKVARKAASRATKPQA